MTAYYEGYNAAAAGRLDRANPYPRYAQGNRDWQAGWNAYHAQG